MDRWLVNGIQHTGLDLNDRGLAYGDGLFETIAIRNGACRFMAAHLTRLQQSCAQLAIPLPDTQQLLRESEQLIANHGCVHGTLKIIVTRGSGRRGYAYDPDSVQSCRIIGISHDTAATVRAGVCVCYCETPVSRNPALAGIKSLNRLPQVLARAEWRDPAVAEGLMSDDRGNLIGGTTTNLFIVHHNQLLTPPVTECGIAGIMRSKVIETATQLGISVDETYFARRELERADEVFLTNSLIGIWPVHEIAALTLATGPVTRRIKVALTEAGVAECGQ